MALNGLAHYTDKVRNFVANVNPYTRIKDLENRLQSAVSVADHALEDLAEANQRIANLESELIVVELDASMDDLTGALNRKAFNSFIDAIEKDVADRGYTGKGCVVALDLDRFKQINDGHGHAAGDEVLKAVVQRLHKLNLIAAETKVFRMGGDEFVIVVLDKRHDTDRRSRDENHGVHRGEDRRKIPFEDYVHNAIRQAINEAAGKPVKVPSNGRSEEVEVSFGISEGIGYFEESTREAIIEALRDADTEAYVRKSGIDEFLEWYYQLDSESQEFVDSSLGLRFDENVRGGVEIDREIGLSAIAGVGNFAKISDSLNPRSLRWLFPELKAFPSKSTVDLSR